MRTKTLLIAAAAMAVGVVSSLAQTTYSQNIVGYVNLTVTNNYQFSMPAVAQLNAGASNGLNEVFASYGANQSGDIVYVWNPASQTYLGNGYLFYWDTTQTPSGTWYDQAGNGSQISTMPIITAGEGVFVEGGGAAPSDTITFSGAVPINPGNSGTNAFLGGYQFTLVSSQLPVSGGLYNLGFIPPDGSIVYIWDPAAQAYRGNGYAFYYAYGWYDQGGNGNVVTGTGVTFTNVNGVFSDIPVSVGQAMFVSGAPVGGTGSTNWIESLAP